EFKGESRPEDVRDFYMPVLEWLESYARELPAKGGKDLDFHFNFEYFNSTSAKYILDIFKILNEIHTKGSKVSVKWHYEEDDEDMLEVGMEMSRMSRLPFEYIETGD
ncbi:MAG: DUF1987 domain-containing protein, partial [Bacteroidetes bacterium]